MHPQNPNELHNSITSSARPVWNPLSCVTTANQKYRLLEWLLAIVVFLFAILIGKVVTPHCREFSVHDASISYPFDTHETVPSWALVPISIAPIVPYGLVSYFFPFQSFSLEFNSWALTQMESIALAVFFTDPVKVYAGRLRPDFLDRLQRSGHDAYAMNATERLETNWCALGKEVREGRLSFPSGHSSISFAAMMPLVMFLIVRLRPFAHQDAFWRLVTSVLPFFFSAFVAVSRTVDHRHHFSDILCGTIIGIVAGLLAFFLNFAYIQNRFAPRQTIEVKRSLASRADEDEAYEDETYPSGISIRTLVNDSPVNDTPSDRRGLNIV